MPPPTHYARSGDVSIAYQVVGTGPRDIVLVPGWVSNIEMFWEEPSVVRAGLHTGECEVMGTVRDLVAGSGLRFSDRGVHTLKGVPDDWHIFAVDAQ